MKKKKRNARARGKSEKEGARGKVTGGEEVRVEKKKNRDLV